ncbi:regulator of nonsense transcripts 1 homolog [Phtheirospermum japonicum]|nr:regulator of nonsense transcripts 1 homolog [Phtheirospermum japonicum]
MAQGSQGLFTQGAFNDQSQEDASQNHFGVANASLQSQNLLNPMYSQPFTHYNSQPLNVQNSQQQHPSQQAQGSQNHKIHYNG